MKLSARNQLNGTVIKIEEGLITSKVVIDLGSGNTVSSIISRDAIADLELKVGDKAIAVIKSTEVIIATPCNCDCGNNTKGNADCGCKKH